MEFNKLNNRVSNTNAIELNWIEVDCLKKINKTKTVCLCTYHEMLTIFKIDNTLQIHELTLFTVPTSDSVNMKALYFCVKTSFIFWLFNLNNVDQHQNHVHAVQKVLWTESVFPNFHIFFCRFENGYRKI